MFKNHWINNETRLLKSELKHKRHPADEKIITIKLFFISILTLFLTIQAVGFGNIQYTQEYYNDNVYNTGILFPDTWKCSNPRCKYENYDGIDYCAMCGTKRKM